jgi:hypothetical protein
MAPNAEIWSRPDQIQRIRKGRTIRHKGCGREHAGPI